MQRFQVHASGAKNILFVKKNRPGPSNIYRSLNLLRLLEYQSFLTDWFPPLFVFQHPFVSQPLSRTLAIELLDKANNPDHSTFNDFDDDDPEPEVTFDLLFEVLLLLFLK